MTCLTITEVDCTAYCYVLFQSCHPPPDGAALEACRFPTLVHKLPNDAVSRRDFESYKLGINVTFFCLFVLDTFPKIPVGTLKHPSFGTLCVHVKVESRRRNVSVTFFVLDKMPKVPSG